MLRPTGTSVFLLSSVVLGLCAGVSLGVSGCAGQLPTWEDPQGQLGKGEAGQTEGSASREDGGFAEAGEMPAPIHGKGDKSCGKAAGLGTRVKDFRLPNAKGDATISPDAYAGRVLLLNFWGTWCAPCLEELPEFDRLYRLYRAQGLTLVAVATDEDLAKVREFVDGHGLAAEVAYQGEDLAGQYGARTFPFTFVVDRKGVIRSAYDGYKPECMGQLELDLRAELEKQ
jgi:peroxiredoxin